MKHKILEALVRQEGRFVSGEELSKALGISRTAVWKHIASLREHGYTIIGQPRSGYALISAPDRLSPEVIRAGLATRVMGKSIRYLPRTGSTNEDAKALASEGAPEGTVVIADEQTAGKGRMGRQWLSPNGSGLWFSVILRPNLLPAETPRLTLAAAVAVARAIRSETGLEAGIKWPNDVLVGGKKVCGILTEMSAEMDRVNYVVLGVGINVNFGTNPFPPGLREYATALDIELGKRVDRAAVLRAILHELEHWYLRYLAEGASPVVREWKSLSVTLGRRVTAFTLRDSFEGVATDVDDDGGLIILRDDGRTEKLLSGDVSLRDSDASASLC